MFNHSDALQDAIARPLWHDPAIMPEPMPALSSDESCELLIVGGGFTGLWAAIQAVERKPDIDIILIEQTFVADGASGRNGGFLNTSITHGETNVEAHFPGEADRLEELGIANMKELLLTLEKYNIDARYEQTGSTTVALDAESAIRLYQDFEESKNAGEDVVWFDKDDMRAQVNSPRFYGGYLNRTGQDGVIDPVRLCFGLRDVLLKQLNVRIFENTKLIGVEPVGKTGMKSICSGGEIFSEKVLLATNAFTSSVAKIRHSVIPVWDYQIATEPLTDQQLEKITWGKSESRHALSDFVNMFHYFRLTQDNLGRRPRSSILLQSRYQHGADGCSGLLRTIGNRVF